MALRLSPLPPATPVLSLVAACLIARDAYPDGAKFKEVGKVLIEGVVPPAAPWYFETVTDGTLFFTAVGDPNDNPPGSLGHYEGASVDNEEIRIRCFDSVTPEHYVVTIRPSSIAADTVTCRKTVISA